jgi:hypothetical protein
VGFFKHAITGWLFIDRFVGAFFLDKTSRLHGQKASAVLVIGSDIAPIVIRSHLLASVFGLTGQRKRNLINVLK